MVRRVEIELVENKRGTTQDKEKNDKVEEKTKKEEEESE